MALFTRKRLLRYVAAALLVAFAAAAVIGSMSLFSPQALDTTYAPSDPARPDRVVLTWSGDPATTQSVTWRTDTTVRAASAQVAVAEASPLFAQRAQTLEANTEPLDVDGVPVFTHSVTFTDLTPNTMYAYRVGDGLQWSEWFHFLTASADAEPFSFIYFGDAQNALLSLWSRSIRAAYSKASTAKFMIHAGDLVNEADADNEWGEWFEAGGWIHAMLPSIPAVGNHEYTRTITGGRRLSRYWQPHFTLPENGLAEYSESTYFIDYQGVRFIVMNTMGDLKAQAEWVEPLLRDNPNRWTILTYHHPMFSSAQGRNNEELRALWKPLFDRYRVDLVLQGHDHTYARGRNLPVGLNGIEEAAGTVYVVSVSGPKMYDLTSERWMERAAENTQLYQIISIEADTLRFESYTVVNELYDAFDLVKLPDAPNLMVDRTPDDVPERTFENTLDDIG